MGTNYFLHETPCSTCRRSDLIHIGKSSGGWSFGFRGYRHNPDDSILSPFGEPVRSREDWLRVVEGYDGEVRDEYGRKVLDPVSWLRQLEPPSDQQWRWEESHMGSYYRPDERDWRDPEGFRFYDGEFS